MGWRAGAHEPLGRDVEGVRLLAQLVSARVSAICESVHLDRKVGLYDLTFTVSGQIRHLKLQAEEGGAPLLIS
jgi:hypothetical protein